MAGRCLVIHPGAVGDVLLALPALGHLARVAPGIPRVVAAAGGPAALLEGSAYAEETCLLDRLGLHRLFVAGADAGALPELAAFDVLVSWFGAGDPTYRATLERLRLRGTRLVVARAAPPPSAGLHASRHLLETLAPLGPVPDAVPAATLPVGPAEREWAATWLAAQGLGRGEAIVLHPGAGSPAKIWPGYAMLTRHLAAARLPVVIVTGPADAPFGVDGAKVARDLPLRRLAALLEAARAFVGNDSGPSHLAAAVGCPTVALFGPTDPAVWAPGGPPGACPHVRVLHGAPGSGLGEPWCGITVERIVSALGVAQAAVA